MAKMLLLSCFLLTAFVLHAQGGYAAPETAPVYDGDTDSLAINFLDRVVVTATGTKRTLKDVPVLTKVLPRAALIDMGAATALDALENLIPGLTFNPDVHGDNIRLQGLDNKYILVLLNGERMVNGRTENVNFSRLNAADIERIEVIDGAASVLYGSHAIGAVINIITREVERPLDIHLGGRYGYFNTFQGDASLGLRGKRWWAKTVLNTKGSKGYRIAAQNGDGSESVLRVNPSRDYSVSQSLGYDFNRRLRAEVYGAVYRQEIFPYQDPTHQRELDWTASARLSWALTGKQALTVAFHTDRYNAFTVFDRLDSVRRNNNYQVSSLRLTDAWQLHRRVQVVLGYEFNHERAYSYNLFGADTLSRTTANHNLFVQGEIRLFDSLSCVLGGRWTQHSEFGAQVTPKISLLYRIGHFRLRAAVSKGFKAPTLKEMYYSFHMGGVSYIKGNPALQPETSWYKSVSVEYLTARLTASVTAWHNSLRHRIATVEYLPTQGLTVPLWQFENIPEARTRGIEASVQAQLFNRLLLTAHYALVDTKDQSTGQPLYGASRHNFTGGLVFRYAGWRAGGLGLPLSVSLSGRLLSPRLYNAVDENGVVSGSESGLTSLWRMVYTQRIRALFGLVDVELQAGVDNIFDRIAPATSVNPGRTWFGALKLRF